MKKKDYQKPATEVVKLNHQAALLTGSGLNDPTDYTGGLDPFGF